MPDIVKDKATAPEAEELRERVNEASAFLKTLSNPDRLQVACALVEGEKSVRQLEDMLGIRQPGLSQQLAELRAAGFVSTRKEGKAVFYSLADGRVSIFIRTMHQLFCAPQDHS
ncbi:ArsR/SmtB family transcription factor [Pseudochrobactrum sp. HB0163]|uniref:ArsR/SmtB family transcription factor n=1 Tax=Pseudochrobactrum sp. HB0163 TaxID=3450708 RepID=UPI003F6E178D